jgi:hypothetical protein
MNTNKKLARAEYEIGLYGFSIEKFKEESKNPANA